VHPQPSRGEPVADARVIFKTPVDRGGRIIWLRRALGGKCFRASGLSDIEDELREQVRKSFAPASGRRTAMGISNVHVMTGVADIVSWHCARVPHTAWLSAEANETRGHLRKSEVLQDLDGLNIT